MQLDLGQHLYPCFSGPTKIPCTRINLKSGRGSYIEISTAEAGTIQLEFRDLARSANEPKYEVSEWTIEMWKKCSILRLKLERFLRK